MFLFRVMVRTRSVLPFTFLLAKDGIAALVLKQYGSTLACEAMGGYRAEQAN